MNTHVDKTQENKSQTVSATDSQKQSSGESTFQFVDNRPEAIAQRKLQEVANNSHQAKQVAQLQAMADNYTAQQHQPIQKKENNTGLPDNLKSGIENLSGYSMDDVKVHRNSDKPAQLNAHAFAQGTDIHLASGQENHLPHEAWHVVQQNQGRVKPTMQMKGKLNVNDDAGLEKEADVMGAKASSAQFNEQLLQRKSNFNQTYQLFSKEKLVVILEMVQKLLNGIPYKVIGSAAAAFHGADIEPEDIDIVAKTPQGYADIKKLFPVEVADQGAKVESAVEVFIEGVYVEFLNPEIGKHGPKDAEPGKFNVMDEIETLGRACTRQKGIRLKEISIISTMLQKIDFSTANPEIISQVLDDIYVAIKGYMESLIHSQQEEVTKVVSAKPKSIEEAVGILEMIKKLADVQHAAFTAEDEIALAKIPAIEAKYEDDLFDDAQAAEAIKSLYEGLSKAGLEKVYGLALKILGEEDTPKPTLK
jgi:hypothetical protein